MNFDGYADAIVGAPGYDDLAIVDTQDGRAFVYYGSPNSPPVALNDSATTAEDTAVTTVNTQGTNGTVVKNIDNTFTYTPNANTNGTDSSLTPSVRQSGHRDCDSECDCFGGHCKYAPSIPALLSPADGEQGVSFEGLTVSWNCVIRHGGRFDYLCPLSP